MKKRVLFSLLAIFFAGFGFGGISMAAVVDCATGNPVVQISGGACYDTLADAVAAVPTDGTETTIILTANEVITGNAGVTIATTKNIVLDLNGHTLSNLVNEDKASQVIKNEGILKIVDNSISGLGMITNNVDTGTHAGEWWGTTQYNYATNVITNGGNLTIEGGTIYEAAAGSICYVVDNNSTSRNTVLTVNGGVLRKDSGTAVRMFCNSITNENILNMNGGLIEGGYTALWIQLPGSSSQVKKATLNVNDGILSGGSYAFYDTTQGDVFDNVQYNIGGGNFEGYIFSYGANISINGGIFNGDVAIKQDNPSNVSVLSGYFKGDLYTYGNNASQNFIRGGIFESDTYEYQGQTYASDWLSLLDTGYKVIESNEGWRVVMDPVATIGTSGYLSLTSAIAAATDGDMIEILKPGTYSLPATISVDNVTIKGNVDGIVFTHSYSDGGVISQIIGSITFENVKFALTDNTNNTSAHYFQSNNITFTNCIIEGLLFGYGTMTFNNCIFEQSVYAYNMWTWRGDITYNDCTFHNTYSSYFINVYHWLSDPNDRHIITVNSGVFTTENLGVGAKVKAAVNIKEAENQGSTSVALQFTVNLNNITTHGTFLTTGWGGSEKYQVDDLLGETTKIDGIDGGTPSYGTVSGGDVVVTLDGTTVYSTPKRDENGLISHIVTFDGTGAVSVNDGATVAKPVNPTKDCYTFSGRYNGNNLYDFNSVVTSDLALVSKWKNYSCGGGGGGGGGGAGGGGDGSTSSSNNSSDTASGTGNTGTVVPTVDPQGVASNEYTNEMNEAYEFAYANGITTKDSIEEAEMFDGLTRIAMAKMLSQYAINVLGKSPADVEVPNFTDVSADLDAEYANGVSLAYKLGIMGINMPDNKFLPYETVTRAQFGTALSRLLFGIEDGEDAYYTTHLAKLKEAGIITNDDPTLEELRGYVMLMLMRSSKGNNTVNNSTEGTVSNENTNKPVNETNVQEQEVEKYFTEAYRRGQIYSRIGDLQRLLQYLGYYNGEINNTFDNNTINAVFDFQIAMGILAADDTSTSRGNVGPKTREVLNQKWAEYKASK